jgi:hypothetical protein
VEGKKVVDILSPLPQAPEEAVAEVYGELDLDGKPVKKPKPKRARKPRTRTTQNPVL